jgi:hypothetical protein
VGTSGPKRRLIVNSPAASELPAAIMISGNKRVRIPFNFIDGPWQTKNQRGLFNNARAAHFGASAPVRQATIMPGGDRDASNHDC